MSGRQHTERADVQAALEVVAHLEDYDGDYDNAEKLSEAICSLAAALREAEEALAGVMSRFDAYTAKDVRDKYGQCCADMYEIARAALASGATGGDTAT